MTRTEQNIDAYHAGDSLTISVTVYDGDGNTLDITGADFEWVLVDRATDTTLLTKSTGGGGISITDATNGEFEISIDSADTQDMDPGYYEHEAEMDDGSTVATVLTGSFGIVGSYAGV